MLKSFAKKYIVKEVGGVKVGLCGVLNTIPIGYSADVLALLSDPRFGPVYSKFVATAPWNLTERWDLSIPERDTPLGNLVADAIRASVLNARCPVDIALEANGYIAAAIYKGKVVGNDVMRALPYGYDPASGLGFKIDTVMLAGLQIVAGLEFSVSTLKYMDDTALQVSGLTFEYDGTKTPMAPDQVVYNLTHGIMEFGRVDPFSIRVNGEPINYAGAYWVALDEMLHGFLVSQGLIPYAEMPTGVFLYNAVRDFMAGRQVLDYRAEGRVIDTSVH